MNSHEPSLYVSGLYYSLIDMTLYRRFSITIIYRKAIIVICFQLLEPFGVAGVIAR